MLAVCDDRNFPCDHPAKTVTDQNEALICTGGLIVCLARPDRGADALHEPCHYQLSRLYGKSTQCSPKGQLDSQYVRIRPRSGGRANHPQHVVRRATQTVKHQDQLVASLSLQENLV